MKTRVFENPVKFAQSVKIKVDGEYVSLFELLQNADIELDETPTSGSDKAVSSGGVFNALQEKQGQISIIENDDKSVDIIIPDAGAVSTGETLRVIEISSLINNPLYKVTEDENGDIYGWLDLTKNGEYLIKNPDGVPDIGHVGVDYLNFRIGYISGTHELKPVITNNNCSLRDNGGVDYVEDYEGLYLSLDNSHLPSIEDSSVYIKVTNNCVYIGQVNLS